MPRLGPSCPDIAFPGQILTNLYQTIFIYEVNILWEWRLSNLPIRAILQSHYRRRSTGREFPQLRVSQPFNHLCCVCNNINNLHGSEDILSLSRPPMMNILFAWVWRTPQPANLATCRLGPTTNPRLTFPFWSVLGWGFVCVWWLLSIATSNYPKAPVTIFIFNWYSGSSTGCEGISVTVPLVCAGLVSPAFVIHNINIPVLSTTEDN